MVNLVYFAAFCCKIVAKCCKFEFFINFVSTNQILTKYGKIIVNTTEVSVLNLNGEDYICLTDMMKAKMVSFCNRLVT